MDSPEFLLLHMQLTVEAGMFADGDAFRRSGGCWQILFKNEIWNAPTKKGVLDLDTADHLDK